MLYRLSDLKRYNNMPRIKSESLAEHQYYCALILIKLKEYIINISYQSFSILLQYLLIHDIGELYTGDIPHNVKEDYPDLKTILEQIEHDKISSIGFEDIISVIEKDERLKLLFKLCDTIQVVQYCENEKRLGNFSQNIISIRDEALRLIKLQVSRLKDDKLLSEKFNEMEFLEKLC